MENEETIEISHYDNLPDKEKLLVNEYLTTFNQTRSYMRIYEVENYDSAKTMACRKFTDVNLKAAIKEKTALLIDERDELAKRVIEEYKKIAFSDIRDVADYIGGEVDFKSFDEIDTSAIKEITCKKENLRVDGNKESYTENMSVKLYDKKLALDSLSKYLGMFIDKTEIKLNIEEDNDFKIVKKENADS